MPKHLTVDEIRALVRQGILLSPEAAQILLDEIERLKKENENAKLHHPTASRRVRT